MIRYFDLGTAYNGNELRQMIQHVFPSIQSPYECYAFEGCKENYKQISMNMRHPKIKFYNYLIADREGVCKLYFATNPSGHSIYEGKKNICESKEYELNPCTRFSVWLKDNFDDLDTSFNILRYNIEGAELDLFRDLDKEDMFKYFKIIKGSSGNDIIKCVEIKDKLSEFQDICRKHNIPLEHKWSWKEPLKMIGWIREKI